MDENVYLYLQEKDEHLELMDGVLIDLLNAKWNTFVKFKFYRQFFTFAFYFLISLVAFTLRPGPPNPKQNGNGTKYTNSSTSINATLLYNFSLYVNDTFKSNETKTVNLQGREYK